MAKSHLIQQCQFFKRAFQNGSPLPETVVTLFSSASKNRSVARACPCRQGENFCANPIGKISPNENYLTTENPGTLRVCPGMPAEPIPVLLRWEQSYILHTAHAELLRPISVLDHDGFPRHSHHHCPNGTSPKPQKVTGDLYTFHILFPSATAATIATVVWVVAFSPLQPSLPSRPSSTTSKAGASTSI